MNSRGPIKILFLDIDGVLNTTRSICAFGTAHMDLEKPYERLDQVGLAFIQRLQKVFNVKIVISSSWRFGSTVKELSEKLNLDVHDRIWKEKDSRGEEIKQWLADCPDFSDFDDYAILDDDTDFLPEQEEHFVHVLEEDGITFAALKKLYLILRLDVDDMAKENLE